MEDKKNIKIIYWEEKRGEIPVLNVQIQTTSDNHTKNILNFMNDNSMP